VTATVSARSSLLRALSLVWTSAAYELRKVSAFRVGFLMREVLRGVSRPIVMIFVLSAVYAGRTGGAPTASAVSGAATTIGGLTLTEAIQYMVLLAFFEKLVFHERILDLSEQIFEGYITKFLVMPFRYFTLPLGRFVQYTLLQFAVAGSLYCLGAWIAGERWPRPASALAAVEAISLCVCASYCFLVWYFVLNCCAFWLGVVWSLLVMSRFVVLFAAGAVLPLRMMPDAVRTTLEWFFPYWAIGGPIEIWSGRAGTETYVRGLAVVFVSACALEILRRFVWRRGLARYAGSGM
jgi:ABC-2 type transport system permease protein